MPEPIRISKPPSLREEWFDGEPRYSVPPETDRPPPVVLPSRGRAVAAGVIVGALAGTIAVAVALFVAKRDVVGTIAQAISRGNLRGLPKEAWAFGTSGVIGIALASLVALVTRHVRRAAPLAIFGMIFAPVLWLSIHVLVLKKHPWLVEALPIGPMLLAAAAFGLVLCLIVPIRGR